MKTYFITGATGAVGSELVTELLKTPDTHFTLLIRAKDDLHMQERLNGLTTFWDLPDGVTSRIKPLKGDMTLPNLGLSSEDYAAVVSETTHIIHCAGIVRMNLSIDDARKSSVNSARNILQLARNCIEHGVLRKIEYVSTVGVAGRRTGVLPETWITEEREFHNTYEQAKSEAEVLVRQAIEVGLPVTVHRPSMVVGNSRTGKILHYQVFYHLCEFLSGRRTFGFLPDIRAAMLDIVPVDYVAQVLAWSSTQQKTAGMIFHLCSGPKQSLTLLDLMQKTRKIYTSLGHQLPKTRMLPVSTFVASLPVVRLFAPEKTKRALKTLPVFLDYLRDSQYFGNKNTLQLFKKHGIHLPLGAEYADTVIRRYIIDRQTGDAHHR